MWEMVIMNDLEQPIFHIVWFILKCSEMSCSEQWRKLYMPEAGQVVPPTLALKWSFIRLATSDDVSAAAVVVCFLFLLWYKGEN